MSGPSLPAAPAASLAGSGGRLRKGFRAGERRPRPFVSRPAAPAAAGRCRQVVEPESWASAPSGGTPVRQRSCRRRPVLPCCAGPVPALVSCCYARQSIPSTAHRPPDVRDSFRRSDFGLLGGVASGFTRRSGSQVQHYLIVLPLHRSEIAALLASSTVRAFGHRSRFDLLCRL